jgi:hypothetical protein
MKEREPRQVVDFPCEVAGVETPALGQVRNLSVGGCCLLSSHVASGKDRLMISLDVPGLASECHFVAEARWTQPGPTPDLYWVGCRFAHTERSRNLVRELLREIDEGSGDSRRTA